MTSQQFVKKTVLYIVFILFLVAAIILFFDPFVHYHKPIGKLEAVETNERSALIGVAKNMDYDTALIGSSMSENFKKSWFEDGVFGTRCVKLPLQGAHFSDYGPMFEEVLKKKDVRNLVFSLDTYLITNNPNDYKLTIPEYMLNGVGIDDVYYLLNKSVLMDYLPLFLINNMRDSSNEDTAYSWAYQSTFDKYTARGNYLFLRSIRVDDMKPYDYFFEYADEFIEDITPYIESREDVTFYLYVPPYSILYWDDSYRKGNLEAEICALSRVYEKLLSYDNVRIFYFQDDLDIITNLDNYRDYSHFDQWVNNYMYQCMRDGKEEITSETYFDTLLNMYEYALNYDYEVQFH